MKLIYATHNPAKLTWLGERLKGLPFAIEGLAGHPEVPEVDESGQDPLENAQLKARAAHKALGRPVVAADSGLYIDGLSDARQPGVHIRRVGGRRLSDDEMIAHYAGIAKSMGGRATARYRNGICVILGPGRMVTTMADEIGSAPFYLVDVPHPAVEEGFPLDSLSVDIDSGKYYNDVPMRIDRFQERRNRAYRDFFCRALAGLAEAQLIGALACAQKYMQADASGHDVHHAMRVWRTALRIAYAEPEADLVVVSLAAILHDIDDGKLTGTGLRGDTTRARAFLKDEGYPQETADAVCAAIATVSYKGAGVETPVSSPEGAVVQDADRLDALGAIGAARTFAYGGTRGRAIHEPGAAPGAHGSEAEYFAASGSSIHHFYEKLLLIGDRMQTPAGRALAKGRHEFLEEYLRRFLAEWEGEL